jgi:hypothetical protein
VRALAGKPLLQDTVSVVDVNVIDDINGRCVSMSIEACRAHDSSRQMPSAGVTCRGGSVVPHPVAFDRIFQSLPKAVCGQRTGATPFIMATLSNELRQALRDSANDRVEIVDPTTSRVYVLVDGETHQRAMDALHREEDLAAIADGLSQANAGAGSPVEEVLKRVRQQAGLKPESRSIVLFSCPAPRRSCST